MTAVLSRLTDEDLVQDDDVIDEVVDDLGTNMD